MYVLHMIPCIRLQKKIYVLIWIGKSKVEWIICREILMLEYVKVAYSNIRIERENAEKKK